MPDNIENVTHEILRNIHASIARLGDRFDHLNTRFDDLEAAMRKDRRNVAGMLVLMRSAAGDFDARVNEIEERVAALEARA